MLWPERPEILTIFERELPEHHPDGWMHLMMLQNDFAISVGDKASPSCTIKCKRLYALALAKEFKIDLGKPHEWQAESKKGCCTPGLRRPRRQIPTSTGRRCTPEERVPRVELLRGVSSTNPAEEQVESAEVGGGRAGSGGEVEGVDRGSGGGSWGFFPKQAFPERPVIFINNRCGRRRHKNVVAGATEDIDHDRTGALRRAGWQLSAHLF